MVLVFVASATTICQRARHRDRHRQAKLSRQQEVRIEQIGRIVARFESIRCTTDTTPSDLVHGLMAMARDYTISTRDGERVSCLQWILNQAPPSTAGTSRPFVRLGPRGWAFQEEPEGIPHALANSHGGQYLAYLSELPIDFRQEKVIVGSGSQAVALVELLQTLEANSTSEMDVSYAALAVMRVAPFDRWKNRFGESWDTERLVRTLLRQQTTSRLCFGTHSRFALAYAVTCLPDTTLSSDARSAARRALEGLVDQQWSAMDQRGHFGTPDLPSIGEDDPLDFSYQAHTMDWLMIACDDASIRRDDRAGLAADFVMARLEANMPDLPYRYGCHAVHALRRYSIRLAH